MNWKSFTGCWVLLFFKAIQTATIILTTCLNLKQTVEINDCVNRLVVGFTSNAPVYLIDHRVKTYHQILAARNIYCPHWIRARFELRKNLTNRSNLKQNDSTITLLWKSLKLFSWNFEVYFLIILMHTSQYCRMPKDFWNWPKNSYKPNFKCKISLNLILFWILNNSLLKFWTRHFFKNIPKIFGRLLVMYCIVFC